MRRYKMVACILLILSVFSSVLAAPVSVQEVRDARADTVYAGDNLIIGSGKRAEEEDHLLVPSSPSSSDSRWTLPQRPGLVSTLNSNPSSSSAATPGKGILIRPGTSTDIQAVSPTKSVSWAPWKQVKLPSGRTKDVMLVPPKPGKRIKPPPRGPYGYSPSKPPQSWQSKGIFSNLFTVAKLFFHKVAAKVKFWR